MIQQPNNIVITKNHIAYLGIFLLAFIYIMPIILMNEYYKDDLEVVMHGMAHGTEHVRPIKDWLLYVLNFSTQLIDIRPLPIVLSSFLASCSALILSARYSEENFFLGACCGLLLFLNPFYIEDLFFGFDCFTITFSVLCAVLPFSKQVSALNTLFNFSISLLCYLLVLLTYQPTIGLVLVLICADYVFGIRDNIIPREVFKKLLTNILTIVIAQVVYLLIFVPLMLSGSYATERSDIGSDVLKNVLVNLYAFSALFGALVQSIFFVFTVLLILFIAFFIFIGWTKNYLLVYQSKINLLFRLAILLVAFLSPVILIIVSLGPLLLLENTVVRARILIGFGGILFIGFLVYIQTFQNNKIFRKLFFVPFFYFFVFMISTTNLQNESARNEYNIATYIYHDIIRNVALTDFDEVFTLGRHTNPSLIYFNARQVNPLVSYIVSTTLYGQWEAVGIYQSLLRLGLKKPYIPKNHSIIDKFNEEFCQIYKPVAKTSEYNIYVIDKVLIVDLSWCVAGRVDGKTTPQGVYW